MKRGINHRHIACFEYLGRQRLRFAIIKKCIDNALLDIFDFAVFQRLVEIDGFDTFEEIGFFDVTEHEVTCLDIELAAVRSVRFVAVVFCGVMTCSDDNACMAVQVPYGE